jgi:metal-responsive CopG/Arc/MetJ family transcriptional regulator
MKTIAISVDEETLRVLDRLASPRRKGLGNRSQIVRAALREYLARREEAERDESEWRVWSKHLARVNKQASELVADQAQP